MDKIQCCHCSYNDKHTFIPVDFNKDMCNETVSGANIVCHSKDSKPIYIRHTVHFKDYFNNATSKLHYHDYHELVFILNGNFAMNVNGQIYKINIGDTMITRNGEPHFVTNIDIGNLDILEINIPCDAFDGLVGGDELMSCFTERKFCEQNIISPDFDKKDLLIKAAKKLTSVIGNGKYGQMLVYSYFIQFMTIVNNVFNQSSNPKLDKSFPDTVYDALSYIKSNLSTVKNLEEISDHLGVSVSYLCRTFKTHIGVSPHEYILAHRIEYAKNLLSNTDKNVMQICYDVGFNDYSGFIHAFRKRVGVTPLKYKKNI